MTVGLLLITHNDIGDDLVATARSMLGTLPLSADALAISQSGDPDALFKRAREICARLDTGGGVLILSDMYGSTPGNIASRLLDPPHIRAVSGVNLPMLVRVLNYPKLSLAELVEKAVSGGRDGIVRCDREC